MQLGSDQAGSAGAAFAPRRLSLSERLLLAGLICLGVGITAIPLGLTVFIGVGMGGGPSPGSDGWLMDLSLVVFGAGIVAVVAAAGLLLTALFVWLSARRRAT